MKQHLDSFNYFMRTHIKKIVQANDLIAATKDPSIYLRLFFLEISLVLRSLPFPRCFLLGNYSLYS